MKGNDRTTDGLLSAYYIMVSWYRDQKGETSENQVFRNVYEEFMLDSLLLEADSGTHSYLILIDLFKVKSYKVEKEKREIEL